MPFPIDVIRRLRLAYLDMPGLSLTVPQAVRLFDADRYDCAVALAALCDGGLLIRSGERYMRASMGDIAPAAAMKLRLAPWDCRWAEPVLAAPAPLWVDACCSGWTCVKDGGSPVLDVRDCRACPKWDPRLATRRRSHQAELTSFRAEEPVLLRTRSARR